MVCSTSLPSMKVRLPPICQDTVAMINTTSTAIGA